MCFGNFSPMAEPKKPEWHVGSMSGLPKSGNGPYRHGWGRCRGRRVSVRGLAHRSGVLVAAWSTHRPGGVRGGSELTSSGTTLIRLLPLGFPQCPDEAFLPVKILASAEEFQTGNFARVDVPRMLHSASEPAGVSLDLRYRARHRDLATLVWRLPSLCCANPHSGASSLENPASR